MQSCGSVCFWPSWIRIRYVRDTDPDSDPSIIKQK
jgi:hypothetical protein